VEYTGSLSPTRGIKGYTMVIQTNAIDAIYSAADMLRSGQLGGYLAQVKSAYGADGDEIWERLASRLSATGDVVEALLALSAQDGSTACMWLLPVIGRLPDLSLVEAKQLLSFSETLGLSYRYMPGQQLHPHIARRPELGVQLGEYLRVQERPGDASVSVWAAAFASGAPEVAATYIKVLLTGAEVDTRLVVGLTGYLQLGSGKVQGILRALEPFLADTLQGGVGVLGRAAWSALCHISGISSRAVQVLGDALRAAIPEAVIAIAQSLYQVGPDSVAVAGVPVGELVDELLQIGLGDDYVRHDIDAALGILFFQPTLRSVAADAVMTFGAVEKDVVTAFPEVFGALANHRKEFAHVLTHWLLASDTNFASLSSLLSLCRNSRAPVVLDEGVFVAQSPERRVKAARRLLALTQHGPTLCEFCALIVSMSTLGSERFHLGGQMLDKAFKEYPGATEEFLRDRTSALPASAPELQVYQAIYVNVVQWRSVLEKLPKLKELIPSDADLEVLRTRKRRINREILRMAAEQSVFASFATKLHVAQGRKFASRTAFGAPEISYMAESSHFVELPSSELADPMRGQLERRNLLGHAR
jgi:hypothetical protein